MNFRLCAKVFLFPTHMWKNGEEKTFSTLFPHREKMQNPVFNRFSTPKNLVSTGFSTLCWKTMWKKFEARDVPRFVSISKISKKSVYFLINFIKTLVICRDFSYNLNRSGVMWCVVVSFPQFPQGFPHLLNKKEIFSTRKGCFVNVSRRICSRA